MLEQIESKLKKIEEKYNINIIMAVEAGSRIWGFESPDSDYDIRFIYVRPLDDYLSIYNHKDDIKDLDGLVDVVGWDLRKALSLSIKSNSSIYEWVNSPVKYKWSHFADELQEIINSQTRLYTHIKHQANLCKAQYKRFIEPYEEVRYKKYIYAIRPILSIMYMLRYDAVAPISMIDTLKKLKEGGLSIPDQIAIEKLIQDKKEKSERDTGPRNVFLDTLIESYLSDAMQYEDKVKPDREKYVERSNSFFRSTVRKLDELR